VTLTLPEHVIEALETIDPLMERELIAHYRLAS